LQIVYNQTLRTQLKRCTVVYLTSSFLLYMPVFAALAGGKVALYHPFQAPAGGKVLYRPLEELKRAVK
jgi:hypothetical protein